MSNKQIISHLGIPYAYRVVNYEAAMMQIPPELYVEFESREHNVFHPARLQHIKDALRDGKSHEEIVDAEFARIEGYKNRIGVRDIEARLYGEWGACSDFLRQLIRNFRISIDESMPYVAAASWHEETNQPMFIFNPWKFAILLGNRDAGFEREATRAGRDGMLDEAWGVMRHEILHIVLNHVQPISDETPVYRVFDNWRQDLTINSVVATSAGLTEDQNRIAFSSIGSSALIPGYNPIPFSEKKGWEKWLKKKDEVYKNVFEKRHAKKLKALMEMLLASNDADEKMAIRKELELLEKQYEDFKRLFNDSDARNNVRKGLNSFLATLVPGGDSLNYGSALTNYATSKNGFWTINGIALLDNPDGLSEEDHQKVMEYYKMMNGITLKKYQELLEAQQNSTEVIENPEDFFALLGTPNWGPEFPKVTSGNVPKGHRPNELSIRPPHDHNFAVSSAVAARFRRLIRNAIQVANGKANGWGSMPGYMSEAIKELDRGTVPWHAVLNGWVTARAPGPDYESSWRRANRRGIDAPGYFKSEGLNILVLIDQSGSCSEEYMRLFYGALDDLSQNHNFVMAPFDTDVSDSDVVPWEVGSNPVLTRTRCGGTDFTRAFEWAQGYLNRGQCRGLIVLTDGGCSRPPQIIGHQVCWVLGPGDKLPFDLFSNEKEIIMSKPSEW